MVRSCARRVVVLGLAALMPAGGCSGLVVLLKTVPVAVSRTGR
jgi:hypothetical protein